MGELPISGTPDQVCASDLWVAHCPDMSSIRAFVLSCSLKSSRRTPSSSLLPGTRSSTRSSRLRRTSVVEVSGLWCGVVDHDVKLGVSSDEGAEWPEIREKLLEADVLVLARLDGAARLGVQGRARAT
jgi:hypothetical protein